MVAALDPAAALAIVIGLMGLGGVIFTAFRFNRDDTTAVVGQQSQILNDMHVLNDELRTTNGELKEQVRELREQIEAMRNELRRNRGFEAGA